MSGLPVSWVAQVDGHVRWAAPGCIVYLAEERSISSLDIVVNIQVRKMTPRLVSIASGEVMRVSEFDNRLRGSTGRAALMAELLERVNLWLKLQGFLD